MRSLRSSGSVGGRRPAFGSGGPIPETACDPISADPLRFPIDLTEADNSTVTVRFSLGKMRREVIVTIWRSLFHGEIS